MSLPAQFHQLRWARIFRETVKQTVTVKRILLARRALIALIYTELLGAIRLSNGQQI
jgi:hypothetical protein